eukprot:1929272-Amphidinium_carterae.1
MPGHGPGAVRSQTPLDAAVLHHKGTQRWQNSKGHSGDNKPAKSQGNGRNGRTRRLDGLQKKATSAPLAQPTTIRRLSITLHRRQRPTATSLYQSTSHTTIGMLCVVLKRYDRLVNQDIPNPSFDQISFGRCWPERMWY